MTVEGWAVVKLEGPPRTLARSGKWEWLDKPARWRARTAMGEPGPTAEVTLAEARGE